MQFTINVQTLETWFDRHHPDYLPMARNQFGDATPGYLRGWIKPNFPVPAIRHQVERQPDRVILWNKSFRNYWTIDYLAIRYICKGLLGECVNCTWPDCEH